MPAKASTTATVANVDADLPLSAMMLNAPAASRHTTAHTSHMTTPPTTAAPSMT